jgi:hypothetical protein
VKACYDQAARQLPLSQRLISHRQYAGRRKTMRMSAILLFYILKKALPDHNFRTCPQSITSFQSLKPNKVSFLRHMSTHC